MSKKKRKVPRTTDRGKLLEYVCERMDAVYDASGAVGLDPIRIFSQLRPTWEELVKQGITGDVLHYFHRGASTVLRDGDTKISAEVRRGYVAACTQLDLKRVDSVPRKTGTPSTKPRTVRRQPGFAGVRA